MKRFLTCLFAIVLVVLVSTALAIIGPWWTLAIPCVIMPFILPEATYMDAFMISFVGIFLLWAGVSIYIDTNNHSMLSNRVAPILFIDEGIGFTLPLLSGLVGGLVGGCTALLGVSIKRIVR